MPDTPTPALLSAERLAELKQLAEQATPGPWQREYDNDTGAFDDYFVEWQTAGPAELRAGGKQAEADADYIAAVAPEVVLGLLTHISALEKAATAREHQYTEALKSLLAECEPDPVDPRHSAESKAFREGSNSDRRVQAKLILAAATSLGIDLTK